MTTRSLLVACGLFVGVLACSPGAPPPPPMVAVAASNVVLDKSLAVADGVDAVGVLVTVVTGDGRPMAGVTVTVKVTGDGATVTMPAQTDAAGQTRAALTATARGTKTVSAMAGGVALTAMPAVVFTAPTAASLAFDVQPGTAQAGVALTPAVTVKVLDARGQAVTGDAPAVALTLVNAQGATLQGGGSVIPVQGVASFAGLMVDKVGVYAVQATAMGATPATSNAITVTAGAPSAATSTFVAAPVSVEAGRATTLTLTVRDANGNPVGGQAVSVASTGTTNTLGAATGVTDAAGVFTTTLTSTMAETKTVTATLGAVSLQATVTVIPGTPATTASSFVVAPTSVTAGVATTLTLTVRDANGNAVGGQAVALASTGTANTFGVASGVTDAAGVFTTTLTSSAAGAKTITATFGAQSLQAGVTFVPGAPSVTASTFVASPFSLSTGGFTALTVTVRDTNGNAVVGQAVALASTGTNNTFGAASGVTDAAGVFTTTLTSTRAETKTVTATFGSESLQASAVFVPGAASATQSSLVLTPVSGIAGGAPVSIAVTVADGFGNPLTGATVALACTGVGNAVSPAAVTTSAGVATGSVSSATGGTCSLTASVSGQAIASAPVVFAAPNAGMSSVLLSTAEVPADGASPATVTVTVRDATSAPLPGIEVTLTYSGTALPAPSTATTSAAGVATFTLTSASATTGTVTATAAGVVVTQQPTLTFVPRVSVGGTIVGLTTPGLVLAAAGQPDLTVSSGAATFTFATRVLAWSGYEVTVRTQPTGQTCRVYNAKGLLRDVDLTSVNVVCHAPWRMLSAGAAHTLGLAADGTVWAWGDNGNGQLGLGDTTRRTTPVQVVATGFAAVSAGGSHSLTVKTDGKLWAWGNNGNGQLRLGDTMQQTTPVQVAGPGFAAVSVGTAHSLAVKTDGTLWAWGSNGAAQLGTEPVPVFLSPVLGP